MTPEQAIAYLRQQGLDDDTIAGKLLGRARLIQLRRIALQRQDAEGLISDQVPRTQAIRTLRRLHGISRSAAYALLQSASRTDAVDVGQNPYQNWNNPE